MFLAIGSAICLLFKLFDVSTFLCTVCIVFMSLMSCKFLIFLLKEKNINSFYFDLGLFAFEIYWRAIEDDLKKHPFYVLFKTFHTFFILSMLLIFYFFNMDANIFLPNTKRNDFVPFQHNNIDISFYYDLSLVNW